MKIHGNIAVDARQDSSRRGVQKWSLLRFMTHRKWISFSSLSIFPSTSWTHYIDYFEYISLTKCHLDLFDLTQTSILPCFDVFWFFLVQLWWYGGVIPHAKLWILYFLSFKTWTSQPRTNQRHHHPWAAHWTIPGRCRRSWLLDFMIAHYCLFDLDKVLF